jgi:hypothetical protein
MGEHNALTPREVEIIRSLAQGGASASSIARTLGRTRSCISVAMRRLRLRKAHAAPLSLELPETTMKLLCAAAARRRMTPEALASEIVGGTVTRGSIEKALTLWRDFLLDTRCVEFGVRDRAALNESLVQV